MIYIAWSRLLDVTCIVSSFYYAHVAAYRVVESFGLVIFFEVTFGFDMILSFFVDYTTTRN